MNCCERLRKKNRRGAGLNREQSSESFLGSRQSTHGDAGSDSNRGDLTGLEVGSGLNLRELVL
jgi:hypothetical protein